MYHLELIPFLQVCSRTNVIKPDVPYLWDFHGVFTRLHALTIYYVLSAGG